MGETIATKNLLLRPLAEADLPTLVAELNNFEIVRNTARIPYPYHMSDAEDFLAFARGSKPRSMFCAMALAASPQVLIGGIGYEFSETKNDAELGYWLSQSHWGKGLMTEAARAMVDHAFHQNRHEVMVACYHDDNPVSGRILQRLGFQRVGACSNYSKAQGRELPVTNMKLTHQRWQETKGAGL